MTTMSSANSLFNLFFPQKQVFELNLKVFPESQYQQLIAEIEASDE